MGRNDAYYRKWLEFLGDVLQQPFGASEPHEERLLDLLNESFRTACTTRNVVAPQWGNRIVACWPHHFIPDEPPGDFKFQDQPLLRWYAFTGQTGPQTIGRVPDALAAPRLKAAWDDLAKPWNVNQQLSIPLRVGARDHHAYLLQRPDRDFTDQELDLAKLLQPVLTGIALNSRLAETASSSSSSPIALTLREVSILSLLSKGMTADSVARRLGISPRTAQKHLEHIYRKLDVRDRLMAVQRAYEYALLRPPPAHGIHNVEALYHESPEGSRPAEGLTMS